MLCRRRVSEPPTTYALARASELQRRRRSIARPAPTRDPLSRQDLSHLIQAGLLPLIVHLYIHVPFCARRCSYCDFAIAVRRVVPSERYVEVIAKEWDLW